MQFVGANEVFRLLLDITMFVSRNQFGRDGRINDIEQCICGHLSCHKTHQVADKGLGHAGIHTIHRHVVTIIGSPSQCQFREVSRTNDDGIFLVCYIHQDLRTFTGLGILVGHIMHLLIMAYILKMLGHSLGNTDFTDSHAQCLHQFNGVIVRTIRRSEAWHRDTYDTLSIEVEFVESLHRHKKCQRGVKAATDAYNGL